MQIQTLRSLGLTLVQSKVYLNLARLGMADPKTIATASTIARQDTYRIISSLEKLGLAERIIDKKIMYKATPIKDGLSLLLQNKKRDYVETEKQIKDTFATFPETLDKSKLKDVQFTITSEFNHLIKMHEKLAAGSKRSIDMAIPFVINQKMVLEDMRYVARAVKRGVRIRFISRETNSEANRGDIEPLSKEPLLGFKYLPEPDIRFGMHIFDNREITLAVAEKTPMPSLWTNSPHVVELASAYFESMWNNAKQSQFVQA